MRTAWLLLALLAAVCVPAADASLFEARHGSPNMAFAVESVETSTSPARADFERWTVTVTVQNLGAESTVPQGFSAYLEAPAQVLPSFEHQDVVAFELPVREAVPPGQSRTVAFVADVARGAQVQQFSLGQRFGCTEVEEWKQRVAGAFAGLPDGEGRWARFQERAATSLNAQGPLTCANVSQPICLDSAFKPLPAGDEPLQWHVEWINGTWPGYVYKVQGAVGARYAAFAGPDTDIWLQTLFEGGWDYLDCKVDPGRSHDITHGILTGPDCRAQMTTHHLVYMDVDGNVTAQTKNFEPPAGLECYVPAVDETEPADDRGLPAPTPLFLALALLVGAMWRR